LAAPIPIILEGLPGNADLPLRVIPQQIQIGSWKKGLARQAG
jgi:hypothetical protein